MSITSHIVRTLFTIGDLKRDLGWTAPEDVQVVANVSYGTHKKWHLLDVYLPKATKTEALPFTEEHGYMEIKRFMLLIVCI